MARDSGRTNFWRQWWRIGGVLGILWVVLFLIGILALQGDSPSRDDSTAEIRQYFIDDGNTYLLGDWLIGLGFVLGFLPFAVVLSSLVFAPDGWPSVLSRMIVVSAVFMTTLGAVAGIAWGALAVGVAENPEVDDGVIRALMEIDTYGFATLSLGIGIFGLSAGLATWLTDVPKRWPGILGVIGGIMALIGALWTIDGDEEGALALIGLIGNVGVLLFVLATSVLLIVRDTRPIPALDPYDNRMDRAPVSG